MTTIAVLPEPPVEQCAPALLPEQFSTDDQVALYRAMVADVCDAVTHGGADLLVNYRQPESVPDGVDPERSLRDLLDEELPEPGEVRYEVQVGESYSGRVGNALTHLLEAEGEPTAAVIEPTAVFVRREHIGQSAMKLRQSDVVLGPAPDGRVYFAAFGAPIDFTDCYAPPAIETLAERGVEADLDVSFLPMTPVVEGSEDLPTAVSHLRARNRAGKLVPPRTTALVEQWGLAAGPDGVRAEAPGE